MSLPQSWGTRPGFQAPSGLGCHPPPQNPGVPFHLTCTNAWGRGFTAQSSVSLATTHTVGLAPMKLQH